MSYRATVIEVLIAGPGDVADERREIADAVDGWNQRHARHMGLILQPVMWETDTYPELGGDPQALINKQLAERCDAVIAVFATRLGTTTPRAASGTVEEIDRFDADRKPVAVYFSEGSSELGSLEPAQLQALRDYKDSLRNRGIYGGYRSISDLRRLIDQYLPALGYRLLAVHRAHQPQQVGGQTAFAPTENDMRVIAAVGRMMVEHGSSHVDSLYLQEVPELSGISEDGFFESVRVLKNRSLLIGPDKPGQGRREIGLTSDGLEMWLLNFTRDYGQLQRSIAIAIALDNVRDPALIPSATGVPTILVEHVLQRWADRDLVIINSLFHGTRIDRFQTEIRRLAEEGEFKEGSEATPATREATTDENPRYRIIDRPIGVDVIAISDLGGELGDPVAAAVRVDGWTVVQVVAPPARSMWDDRREEHFRSQVRRLAATHDLLGRRGEVRLVFDPPQTSAETRNTTAGEPVERKSHLSQ